MFFFSSCHETIRKPAKIDLQKTEELPSQEIWNGEILISEDNEIKAKVYADYIASYSHKDKTYLTNVTIYFYRNGEIESFLKANKGIIENKTKNMYAYDSVFAQNKKDSVNLLAKDLKWIEKDKKITSKSFVRIENLKEQEILEGYGFEANQDLSFYTIFNITYQSNSKTKKHLRK